MTNKNNVSRVGSEAQYGPRLVGGILHDYLENSNEPLAVAYREHTTEAEEQGWNRNTDLCVDVKTILHSDHITRMGKQYQGVLTRDSDEHYSFVETLPAPTWKRNPQVFEGKHITVTRRSDGTFHPNFRPMKVDEKFSVDAYAIGVCNELRKALKGLVEEREF